MGLDTRKPDFGGLQTNGQTSLCIPAVWSALCYYLFEKYNI